MNIKKKNIEKKNSYEKEREKKNSNDLYLFPAVITG